MTQTEADRLIRKIEEYRKSLGNDKEKAVKELQGAGILDSNGKLAKPYR